MAGTRANGSAPLVTIRREPSEDAIVVAAANMLRLIDRERGACLVTQLTNGHAPEDLFELREGPTAGDRVSYLDRRGELDHMEDALLSGLSDAQRERAQELAHVS